MDNSAHKPNKVVSKHRKPTKNKTICPTALALLDRECFNKMLQLTRELKSSRTIIEKHRI